MICVPCSWPAPQPSCPARPSPRLDRHRCQRRPPCRARVGARRLCPSVHRPRVQARSPPPNPCPPRPRLPEAPERALLGRAQVPGLVRERAGPRQPRACEPPPRRLEARLRARAPRRPRRCSAQSALLRSQVKPPRGARSGRSAPSVLRPSRNQAWPVQPPLRKPSRAGLGSWLPDKRYAWRCCLRPRIPSCCWSVYSGKAPSPRQAVTWRCWLRWSQERSWSIANAERERYDSELRASASCHVRLANVIRYAKRPLPFRSLESGCQCEVLRGTRKDEPLRLTDKGKTWATR